MSNILHKWMDYRWRLLVLLCLLSLAGMQASGMKPITYDEAIRIALGESYTVKYYKEEIDATRYSYLYTRSEFKPLLDFNLFTPSWNEALTAISQADGLPVYNSTGSLQAGGNLNFTYVLPTGGNFAFSSRMYWENYRTTLSERENEELKRDQVYSRFALSFSQPIFTANKLKENMKVAELDYRKSTCYFTRVQMDIVYDVTESFYQVYKLAYEHKINQDRLVNSREAYRITKLKQEMGNLPEGEMLIAEITVAQDEARVMESEGRLEAAKDDFKLLIGLELKEEIDLQADMEFEAFLIDMQQAIDEALRNRMEIQENNLDIQLQSIEVKRAKREREFKGSISAYYDFTGLSTREDGTLGELTGSSFRNMVDRPSNRGVAFTVSYPIADWGRAKNQVRREQVRLKQRELNLENTKRIIEREVREIVRSVYEAEKRFRINRRNQEVAVESYRISQLRFENGDMTSQELSIEQDRLSQVQLSYIESYVTYRLSVANLNRKTMYDFENKRSFLLENPK
ncbi:outer membrane protein [Parabacteroides sp. PF5-5]|uniref:TolC family protein n=1 Tax=unclassified Parabacteroides TaxID=2649774 RepID=UPI0024748C8F|nr:MULTISPECIES: TolC family protein [unclassified Parabacteroides]MDH6303899.1 outer membrane protein [Parabacteroides sp. PH5-39]MDH6314516.1 outer membrane protein [Parabacteroides sp. PF5-13]MDH6318419.1 outer membrane protein [Parabacteroides sp. PH5-13]MDH6322288.1 outer membrane protein [Parabacteroides sp. PH5-8]MDH6325632.1 outer membrane protein [Parabacteroides sp. PH5-41]